VCCRLKFALTQDEIERGHVKWDIGHPYVIRQDSTGYCSHNDCATRSCTIYNDRPRLCREYSCRYDQRIWADFDAMVLNTEWITEHLAGADAILLVDAEPPDPVETEASSSVTAA
jgi:Fe-S-cluster containining protein